MTTEHFSWERMQDVGEVFAPMVESFQKKADETKAFADKLRIEVAKVKPMRECIMHEGIFLPLDWDATFSASWFDKKTTFKFGQCPECEKERLAPIVNEKWLKMGIPTQCLNASFDNFHVDTPEKQKALDRVKFQVDRGRGFIILHGKVGAGKSHMGAAVIKAAGSGNFITMADLIGELRQGYNDHNVEKMVVKYRATKVFVLDELDASVKGVDIQPLLYRILADRYDKNKMTVLTSNENLNGVLDILGPRLQDRIKASFQSIPFTWDSYRGTEVS